jgi:hypothetical protein
MHKSVNEGAATVVSASGRDELVRRVAEIATRADDPDYLRRLNPESSRYKLAQHGQVSGVSKEELDEVGRDLARHFGLDPDGRIYVRSSPSGSGSGRSRDISARVIARARFAVADAVMEKFERAFVENAADVREVVAIWGINPREPIEVRPGIHLTGLASIPPSLPRDILAGIATYANSVDDDGAFEVRARPTAALSHSFTLSPVVSATYGPWPPVPPGAVRAEEMLEIARCLTLVIPRPVEHIGSWYQADIDHPLVGGGVGGWGGQPIRRVIR